MNIPGLISLIALTTLPSPTTNQAGQMMRAIRFHEFGGPEVLKLEDAPRPAAPGEGEMLVRVHAAGVNPIDWKIRAGGGRGRANLPYTPGFDVSGVVESVGPMVDKFKAGDAVFALIDLRRGGCYAEYVIVKDAEAAAKPAKISHTDAAGVPLVALTTWQALFDTAKLENGQTILIHGGAGGVGSIAVQLAHWKGARVLATASKDNLDFLKQLGADVAIDYRNQKFEEIGKDVDVVLDTVGGETQARSFAVIRKGGVLVSIVGPPSKEKADDAGIRAASIRVHPSGEQLAQIGKLLDEGSIKPVVTQIFSLADAAKAHEQSETRHTRGKIVLQVIATSPTSPAEQRSH
jgi:NADPH:quinone reductase-like Zn-dependent oxidoreductase